MPYSYNTAITAMIVMAHADQCEDIYSWLGGADGVCQVRETILEIAPIIDDAWEVAKRHGYDDPYDFEFVPEFLRRAREACFDCDTLNSIIAHRIAKDMAAEFIRETHRISTLMSTLHTCPTCRAKTLKVTAVIESGTSAERVNVRCSAERCQFEAKHMPVTLPITHLRY